MLYTYSECLEKFGSKYYTSKLVSEGKLFKQEKGFYSDESYICPTDYFSKVSEGCLHNEQCLLLPQPDGCYTGEILFDDEAWRDSHR